MEDKNMELIEVIENIVENSDELEKLLELKKFDEMYQLLKENGYEKGPEILKKDVEELTKEGLMNLENIKLSKVSGGRLKENINKATSLGMASLLMLGASPMGPKANATGFRSNGVKAPVSASTPVNSNKEQGSPKKSLVIPSRKGNNIIKAIGAVAAVAGVGALGYGARELQDKIFKPEQKPDPEPKVETVREIVTNTRTITIKEEKFIDYEEFIEKHVGKCNVYGRAEKKACFECIQKINNILGVTGPMCLSNYTHKGFDVNRDSMDMEKIGRFLCHAVTGYACGEPAKEMKNFENESFSTCLKQLVVFEAFAEEFQDQQKHEKIKQCIECLIDLYEKIDNCNILRNIGRSRFETAERLRYSLNILPKFAKKENFHKCVKLCKVFSSIYDFALDLYERAVVGGKTDNSIKNIKIIMRFDDSDVDEEYMLDDFIVKYEAIDESDIKKVVLERTNDQKDIIDIGRSSDDDLQNSVLIS